MLKLGPIKINFIQIKNINLYRLANMNKCFIWLKLFVFFFLHFVSVFEGKKVERLFKRKNRSTLTRFCISHCANWINSVTSILTLSDKSTNCKQLPLAWTPF